MLYIAAEAARTAIEGMCWVERYGGLAIPVSRPIQIGTMLDENNNEQPVIDIETFPVTYGMSAAECWEKGGYKSLHPDSKYKSLLYFEQLGNMRLEGDTRRGAYPVSSFWTGSIRLVAWLNLQKLTATKDIKDGASNAVYSLVEALNYKSFSLTQGVYKDSNVTFKNPSMLPKDFETIFGKYSYQIKDPLYFWPHDFFAVDWEVEVRPGCLEYLC